LLDVIWSQFEMRHSFNNKPFSK